MNCNFSSMSLTFLVLCTLTVSTYKVPTESYLSRLSWQESPLYNETQPDRRLSQSEPPSPAPGQQPLQVMDLWEQYLDLPTGRCYYVNSITKERSYKPPRRARGRTSNQVKHPTQVHPALLVTPPESVYCLVSFPINCFKFSKGWHFRAG